MGKRRQWDEKTYRTTWEDVENWVQACYEDFGGVTRVSVVIPYGSAHFKPAVRVELYKPLIGSKENLLWSEWKNFDERLPHAVEHWALQMLSQAWLELDLERQRAERQAPLL